VRARAKRKVARVDPAGGSGDRNRRRCGAVHVKEELVGRGQGKAALEAQEPRGGERHRLLGVRRSSGRGRAGLQREAGRVRSENVLVRPNGGARRPSGRQRRTHALRVVERAVDDLVADAEVVDPTRVLRRDVRGGFLIRPAKRVGAGREIHRHELPAAVPARDRADRRREVVDVEIERVAAFGIDLPPEAHRGRSADGDLTLHRARLADLHAPGLRGPAAGIARGVGLEVKRIVGRRGEVGR